MIKDEHGMQRRVAGFHDIRMDGMTDLVMRAKGASVFDIGCNRGLVAFEFANNGATQCLGCDNYAQGIDTARHLFADFRHVKSRFEVVDLTGGEPELLKAFGQFDCDITVMLATYHKLKRLMSAEDLTALIQAFGRRTKHYFAWRATSDKPGENEEEMKALDRDLKVGGFQRVHTSYLSKTLGVAAIWEKA